MEWPVTVKIGMYYFNPRAITRAFMWYDEFIIDFVHGGGIAFKGDEAKAAEAMFTALSRPVAWPPADVSKAFADALAGL